VLTAFVKLKPVRNKKLLNMYLIYGEYVFINNYKITFGPKLAYHFNPVNHSVHNFFLNVCILYTLMFIESLCF